MKKSELVKRVKQLELDVEILKLALFAEQTKPPHPWPEPYITWKDTTRPFVGPNTTLD